MNENTTGAKNGEHYETVLAAALTAIADGRSGEARQELERLCSEPPVPFEVPYLLAFLYHDAGDYQQALQQGAECLKILQQQDAPPDITDARQKVDDLCLTLGNSAMQLHQDETALQCFEQGLAFSRTTPALYQNIAVVHVRNGRSEAAVDALNRGRALCPDNAELHRMAGVMLDRIHEYGAAGAALEQAVALGSVEALQDAAAHWVLLSRPHKAKDCIDRYCQAVPGNETARALQRELQNDPRLQYGPEPTLSVAMIVKNEEEMLAQCLASIRDLWDQLVIVDTGSTDRTVEIAESFGAEVFHHPWRDSFSEARNHSLDHATGDWILYIDADEELVRADIPKLLSYCWNRDIDAVNLAVFSALPGQLGSARGKHYYPRLFRRDPDMRFTGIVHNLLTLDNKRVSLSEVRILHYGYDLDQSAMKKKFTRSLDLLLKQVEEMPDDPFVRYNTAQMYLSRNYTQEALPHAEHILKLLGPEDEGQRHLFLMAHFQLALVHFREGRFEESERYCRAVLQYKPDYIDPLITLGMLLARREAWDEAERTLHEYLTVRERLVQKGEFNLLILNKLGSDFEAWFYLGVIADRQGRLDEAQEHLERALEANEYFWRPYALLADMAIRRRQWDLAVNSAEAGIKCAYVNAEKYGTLGAQHAEFRQLLVHYKTALVEQARETRNRHGLDDALARVDALLNKDQD